MMRAAVGSTDTDASIGWTCQVDGAPTCLAVAVHRSGTTVAVGTADADVSVLDGATGQVLATTSHPGGVLALGWAADGSLLVGGPEGSARWNPSGGVPQRLGEQWCAAVACTDGSAAVADGRETLVLDVSGVDRPPWRTPAAASTVTAMRWLPRRRLAVAAYGGVVVHGPGPRPPATTYRFRGSALDVDTASNGRWLAAGFQDATVHTWRVRDGHDLSMSGYPRKVTRLRFDPTGRWLATNGGSAITVWDYAGAGPAGSRPLELQAHATSPTALAWHPTEVELLSGGQGGLVARWTLDRAMPGVAARPIQGWQLPAPVAEVAWHPRGTSAFAACIDGSVVALEPT
jgi:WD40 repeat protein